LIDRNLDCHIVICGDFNVDFSRNWLHTELLRGFCENIYCRPVCGHHRCTVDYTYNFNMSRFNVLDHFLLSGVLYDSCVERSYVLHDVDNLSDHDPIMLDLVLDVQYVGCASNVYTPRASWKKASDLDLFNYKSALSRNLANLHSQAAFLTCHDMNCSISHHFSALTDYVKGITDACINACKSSIPSTSLKQQSGRIAGWSEYVQPLREKSLFWHHLWVENGRPHSGTVADCMRRSRASYHYAVRFVKKNEDNIRCERVVNSAAMNDIHNFWSEVKKIRASKPARCRTVDGVSDDNGIAQLFASKYKDLYNSVPYNKSEMMKLIELIDANVINNGYTQDCVITAHDVKLAISKLKAHKSDGNFELNTDHFLNASDDLYIHVALLLSSVLVHGFSPKQLCTSTVIPIPKGCNVNMTDSVNFRGIALSSIFVKIFDHIVLQKYYDYFCTSELQFGFKAKYSTHMCTMILKETLLYYNNTHSTAFCMFLDATKAFDRVRYCKLFHLLVERGLPACVIRVLICLYTNHMVCVAWNGAQSQYFTAANGVKQGGVLSPVLYLLYTDGLLVKLSNAGVGCYFGSFFVGALAYADDLVLLAPTPSAMRKLLAICDEYAQEFSIVFNANKSKWLAIVPKKRRWITSQLDFCHFRVGGTYVERVNSFVHLGHIINTELNDKDDISHRRCAFIGQVNNVLCYFPTLTADVRYKLFRSYCSSIYGCELWQLNDSSINTFCTAWRTGLRRIWNIPNVTHSDLTHMLSDELPIYDELCRRSLMFIYKCFFHSSNLVKFVTRYGVMTGRHKSTIGSNFYHCVSRYNLNQWDFYNASVSVNDIVRRHCVTVRDEERFSVAQFLQDSVIMRDIAGRFGHSCILTRDELNCIVHHLATM